MTLTPYEARILGALLEKAATTPDGYPLTTNALRSACNQISNRDPVVDYDERLIDATMMELRQRGLARTVNTHGSRASKHKHVLDEALGLAPDELAVLAVLLLRGPQTVNELTTRTERYAGGPHGAAGVEAVIERLSQRADPMVVRLARRIGEREPRVAHLLDEEQPDAVAAAATSGATLAPMTPPSTNPGSAWAVAEPPSAAVTQPPTASAGAATTVAPVFRSSSAPPPSAQRATVVSSGPPAAQPRPGTAPATGHVATATEVAELRRRIDALEALVARQGEQLQHLLDELGG